MASTVVGIKSSVDVVVVILSGLDDSVGCLLEAVLVLFRSSRVIWARAVEGGRWGRSWHSVASHFLVCFGGIVVGEG